MATQGSAYESSWPIIYFNLEVRPASICALVLVPDLPGSLTRDGPCTPSHRLVRLCTRFLQDYEEAFSGWHVLPGEYLCVELTIMYHKVWLMLQMMHSAIGWAPTPTVQAHPNLAAVAWPSLCCWP